MFVLDFELTKKTRINPRISYFPELFFLKFERTVFCIDVDGLAFADFAFENIDAERVENFFLNRTAERARAVDRVISFAREQLLGRVGELKRDLLLVEAFRQAAKLN